MKTINRIKTIAKTDLEIEFVSYCEKQPQNIYNHTLDELAKYLFTSPSSILNIIKKAGFTGFNDFKFSIKRDMVNKQIDNQNTKHILDTVENSLKTLKDTLDFPTLMQIITTLRNSSRIYIHGIGLNSPVAKYLHDNLLTLDIPTLLIRETSFLNKLSKKIDNHSTLFIYSTKVSDEKFEHVLKNMKDNNITTILITSKTSQSAAIELFDYVVRTTDQDRITDELDTNSRIGYYFVTQVIIDLLLLQDKN